MESLHLSENFKTYDRGNYGGELMLRLRFWRISEINNVLTEIILISLHIYRPMYSCSPWSACGSKKSAVKKIIIWLTLLHDNLKHELWIANCVFAITRSPHIHKNLVLNYRWIKPQFCGLFILWRPFWIHSCRSPERVVRGSGTIGRLKQ